MDRILISLLLVLLGVGAFFGIQRWYVDKESKIRTNTTNQVNKAVKNSIEDNIK